MIGSVFIIEAHDMNHAVDAASLHPSLRVAAGEGLAWRVEIRPVHYFESTFSNV